MKHKLKTSIVVTTFAVGVLHIINCCINAASTVKNLLNRDRGKYFSWRFGKVYYTKTGTGRPLLLIHDLNPFSCSYEWSQLVHKLSADHTVYTLDLPGCGRSEKPNMTYTNFLFVQLITDFVKQIIGQKTDIAATGISSSFVVMACHNDPELFHKIIMINPESLQKLNRIPGKRAKALKFIMEFPILGTTIYHILSNKSNIDYLFTEKYLYNPFRVKQKYIHVYHEAAHLGEGCGKYLQASLCSYFVNANITHALSEVNNSLVIISGNKCPQAKQTIADYQRINPAIEAVLIDDCKLLPQLEVPDALYSHFKIFF